MAPDFGSSWSCVTDLVMPSTMATGFRVVAEAIARRWSTPRGRLIDDPDYGYDVTGMVGDTLDTRGLARLATALAHEAEKDERVKTAQVTVALAGDSMLIVTGSIETSEGPFKLVVSVSDVSVTLLQVRPS